jgi:hypothetical protein
VAPAVPPVPFCHVPEAPALGAAGPASAALAAAAGELNVPSGCVGLKSGPEFGLSVTASIPLDDGAEVAGGVSREPQANETATPKSMDKNFMEHLERRRQVPTPRPASKERAAVVRTRGRDCAAFDPVEARRRSELPER